MKAALATRTTAVACPPAWRRDAAAMPGMITTRDDAREAVYGRHFSQFKARQQAEAAPERLAALDAARRCYRDSHSAGIARSTSQFHVNTGGTSIMMTIQGICPKCGKRVLHVNVETVVGMVAGASKSRCITHSCIHCNVVLGVQIDHRAKPRPKRKPVAKD